MIYKTRGNAMVVFAILNFVSQNGSAMMNGGTLAKTDETMTKAEQIAHDTELLCRSVTAQENMKTGIATDFLNTKEHERKVLEYQKFAKARKFLTKKWKAKRLNDLFLEQAEKLDPARRHFRAYDSTLAPGTKTQQRLDGYAQYLEQQLGVNPATLAGEQAKREFSMRNARAIKHLSSEAQNQWKGSEPDYKKVKVGRAKFSDQHGKPLAHYDVDNALLTEGTTVYSKKEETKGAAAIVAANYFGRPNEKVLVTWNGHQKPMLVDFKDLCLFWNVEDSQFRKGQIVVKKGTDAMAVVQKKCAFWRVRVKWLTGKWAGQSRKVRRSKLYIPMPTLAKTDQTPPALLACGGARPQEL